MISPTTPTGGFIRSYGMFWDRHEIEWSPGRGNRGQFRLLGRVGENRGNVRLCDFRSQRGIYVLYDDHGPTYVGLAKTRDLGLRLRDHTKDSLSEKWERFSWFGFCRVLKTAHSDGTRRLAVMPEVLLSHSQRAIRDIEALLIQCLGTYRNDNIQKMKFTSAEKWEQVGFNDTDHYLKRLQ